MMKIFCILLLTSILYSQELKITDFRELPIREEIEFHYPKFSPDNKFLLLTTPNFIGLWTYDLEDGSLQEITKDFGAGYNAVMAPSGEKVAFKRDEYIKYRKFSSILIYNIPNGNKNIVVENQRDLYAPIFLDEEKLAFLQSGERSVYDLKTSTILDDQMLDMPMLIIENGNLVYWSEDKLFLNPLGEGNYIWPSLSNGKDDILFTLAGDATYVCDLNGKILHRIENANYPSWSPDDKYILFMEDKDDGYKVVSSDIKIYSIERKRKYNLTPDKDMIFMYPDWSPSMEKIVFCSLEGKLYISELLLNDGGR
jgi:Tol biopolymer transport system component